MSNQSVGQGSLIVRFTNETTVSDIVDNVGIGDIFIIAGQSNASGRGNTLNNYTHGSLKATLFGNDDTWKNLEDATDNNANQVDAVSSDPIVGGSPWPLIATYIMASENIPVAFVPTSIGATTILQWQPGANHSDPSTLYGSMNRRISAVGGSAKAILFFQGEWDLVYGTSQAVYESRLNTFVNTAISDFAGLKTMVGQIGETKYSGDDAVRAAQIKVLHTNVNAILGPVTYDINLTVDNLHFKTDTEMAEFARRWYKAIDKAFYGGTNGYGPIVDETNVRYDLLQNKITVPFTDDTYPVIKPASTVEPSSFELKNDGNTISISSVTIVDDIIEISPAVALNTSQSVTLTYASLNEGVDKAIYDNDDLPAENFYNIDVRMLNIWDGSENTDWNTSNNWSMNLVPTTFDDVIIPNSANNPEIDSGVAANCINLTVESGASLTIKNGGSLINTGTITYNGTIDIEKSISVGEWHLISIPTTGITANTFVGDYLQSWNETIPEWVDIKDTETILNTNIGYALWAVGGKSSYTFTGAPLTGTQIAAVSLSDNFNQGNENGNDGANLLGNPYPSSIDWSDLYDTWGAVYYWDPSANAGAGDYIEWNDGAGSGSQYVSPMQGFFIVVNESNTTNGSGIFELTNDDRVHSGATNFYKSKLQNGIVLEARSGENTDELFIRFNEDASPDFDLQRDALKFLSGADGISQLYAITENWKLAIDVRPETETIQLGFENETDGIYSISAKERDGILKIILEDTKTEKFHNLGKADYEFAWDVTDNEKRFKLHLDAVEINKTPISESNILIYAANQQIFIKGAEKGTVSVMDVMGRIVLQQAISGSELTGIPVNLRAGVYVVVVKTGLEISTQNVFIKS
ncbi:Uncharacterised protein [Candidatus Venteria ishoeyi]|uniref:Sialate O-acetylesterase domain-containing protein n=1 Tax=Candidatus Venteria ishoeyi TaxID=1899563 RepID=A0A1H6F8G7_9GAMM|nr:Uncharacterised protein [Candidatus Venteria ishoeyi]